VALEDALALEKAPRVVTSLDRPVGEEGDTTLGALLPAEALGVGEEFVLSLRRETVRRVVDELPEPDREVVRSRFGIDDGREPQTQAAVARRLGLTRKQVRKIEERALGRLARLRELDAFSDAA
jgi:RNA polymerase primary sigma factor